MNLRFAEISALVLIVAFCAEEAKGADGPLRTWTDASGNFTVEAQLVQSDGERIQLRGKDGRIINITRGQLSGPDQQYLRALAKPAADAPAQQTDWVEIIGPEGPTGVAHVGEQMALCGNVRLDPNAKTLIPVPGKGVVAAPSKIRTGEQSDRNLISQQKFGDCEVHLEFLIGEGANSGVKLQQRYEIQLKDSYGKDKPTAMDCGGIYPHWKFGGEGKGLDYIDHGYPPRLNAAKPAGQWQTLAIVFAAPRFDPSGKKTANARLVAVVLNGKLIHENLELDSPTGNASTPLPETSHAPLYLQMDHGAVAFRNVRVRPTGDPQPEITQSVEQTPKPPAAAPPETDAIGHAVLPDSARLVRLTEISHPGMDDVDPWISFDGQTLYWCRYDCDRPGRPDPVNDPALLGLFSATRDADGQFKSPRRLISQKVRHPTVNRDGLTMVCLASQPPDGERLFLGRRPSVDRSFESLRPLPEVGNLCPHPYYKFPVFLEDDSGMHFAHFTARDMDMLRWPDPSKPLEGAVYQECIALDASIQGNFPWPIFFDGGRRMLCPQEVSIGSRSPGGGLTLWRRDDPTKPFTEGFFLTLPNGRRLPCRAPRYCKATKELFFASKNLEDLDAFHATTWDLWVIRGFAPEQIVFP